MDFYLLESRDLFNFPLNTIYMNLTSQVLVLIVCLEHLYILWMEMFAWTTVGKKTFKGDYPEGFFESTKSLAANQGLYNGFLAAGLAWTFFIDEDAWAQKVAFFFLVCIVIAGVYGALTASKSIFFKQGLPAIITILVIYFTN